MGVETPMPPKMINAAAPDGTPPRRIKYLNKNAEKLLAPPHLGEALRRGTLITE